MSFQLCLATNTILENNFLKRSSFIIEYLSEIEKNEIRLGVRPFITVLGGGLIDRKNPWVENLVTLVL
jgi:hypothetical protein